ncbi:unnamed protein product, partial [Chrysoparadoxa australica]
MRPLRPSLSPVDLGLLLREGNRGSLSHKGQKKKRPSSDYDASKYCGYCKKPGHELANCRTLAKLRQLDKQNKSERRTKKGKRPTGERAFPAMYANKTLSNYQCLNKGPNQTNFLVDSGASNQMLDPHYLKAEFFAHLLPTSTNNSLFVTCGGGAQLPATLVQVPISSNGKPISTPSSPTTLMIVPGLGRNLLSASKLATEGIHTTIG